MFGWFAVVVVLDDDDDDDDDDDVIVVVVVCDEVQLLRPHVLKITFSFGNALQTVRGKNVRLLQRCRKYTVISTDKREEGSE